MKIGFYPKLALDGIRKNRRMYLPYLLTCVGMVMMYYIIAFLRDSSTIASLPSGAMIVIEMMGFGGWIIAAFSCIFLFYTNSFLIRRRKKEFGLYNILGMGKWNIARILFWESFFIAFLTLGIGLLLGIVFSKIAELGLVNIMGADIDYTLSVSPWGIAMTVMIFGVIFILLFFNALRQVRFSSAIALIKSENAGEKPPKANWFFGFIGILILAGAYYLAVTIKEPVEAFALFFVAVIMVIVGTYLIMITGSVMFCRILQKKKKYYYKSNHFVSVASMVYRMKRNGAGLASICILATMVLVMISSTTSLYFGGENALKTRYPREINMTFRARDTDTLSDENITTLHNDILEVVEKHGALPQNFYHYGTAEIAGLIKEETVEVDVETVGTVTDFSNICQFYFVSLADYNAMMGKNETLDDGEVLISINRGSYEHDRISFNRGNTFQIKKQVDEFFLEGESTALIFPCMAVIVPDLEDAISGLDKLAAYNGDRMISLKWIFDFDTGVNGKEQIALYRELIETFSGTGVDEKYGTISLLCGCREFEREDFYGLFGSLFYLGIMLSIVFIFAAVLIIYYKQVSEGYEDQARFEIMQKVGMTKREIRKSINSQLLTVFFLPLIFAAMHLAFAFPMIRKLLLLFNLNNVILFAITTLISVIVFALFYTLVYRITSNAYYNIVSGVKEKS